MNHFANVGYSSIALDLRGHGKSGGSRMFIKGVEDYLQDIDAVIKYFDEALQGPWVMLGHSMGGLVVLRHRQTRPNPHRNLCCTVLTSPFLGIAAKIPAWKTTLSKLVVGIAPKIAVPTDLDANFISHDKAIVKAYIQDPMVAKKTTAGWFEAIVKAHSQAFADQNKTPEPLHILAAGDDRLVSVESTKTFFEGLKPSKEYSLQVLDGWFHEILNETDRETAYLKLEDIFGRYCR
jgi:lysophospholipase